MWRGLMLVAVVALLGMLALAGSPPASASVTAQTHRVTADEVVNSPEAAAIVWFVEWRANAKKSWTVVAGPYAKKKVAQEVATVYQANHGGLVRVVKD